MHVSRGGYCGVAPLPDGHVNVAMVFARALLRGTSAGNFFDHWIHAHPKLEATLEGCRLDSTVRGLHPVGSRARRVHGPGFLLVGDAAGFFDPFTGEGIYRAIVGAELVARTARAALSSGDISAVGLKPYEQLRSSAFSCKSRLTRLVQLFVQSPLLMEYALPRLASRSEPTQRLSNALGDLVEARQFLNPSTMASARRP